MSSAMPPPALGLRHSFSATSARETRANGLVVGWGVTLLFPDYKIILTH
jgi:hypothetical protein